MSKEIFDRYYNTCYTGSAALLFKDIDHNICKLFKDFATEEVILPSIIDDDILERLMYYKEFPNYLCYSRDYLMEKEKFFLTPSACLQIYPIYKRFFENANPQIVSALVEVYRTESKYDYFRKRDFYIREIVFFGEREEVQANLDKVWKDIFEYSKSIFGEKVFLKFATDNFYPSTETRIKKKMQVANQTKEELVFKEDEKELAIASKNIHGKHFSRAFNFTNNQIETACIGIGLDRWVKLIKGEYKNVR